MHEARRRTIRHNPRKPAYCETGRPDLRRTSGLAVFDRFGGLISLHYECSVGSTVRVHGGDRTMLDVQIIDLLANNPFQKNDRRPGVGKTQFSIRP
jgi:hypothetical protein